MAPRFLRKISLGHKPEEYIIQFSGFIYIWKWGENTHQFAKVNVLRKHGEEKSLPLFSTSRTEPPNCTCPYTIQVQCAYHHENLFTQDMWGLQVPRRENPKSKTKIVSKPLNQCKLMYHAKPHALWTAMIIGNIFHQGKSKFLISCCFPAHFWQEWWFHF